ncbi:CDP-diacylglycerol--serine O-phosphatidyltransferase [Methylophilus rhizosphaerae]|uniref:CDP-diacylglycerol--serine O-phosphatidyltransferase n=1 Tax=Methylophilus rhizosphaerae TaxID=492660 RepID=A0A1G9EXH1_9PROT|nr:CDP-diacylglycerol--serine O-phosphatidyltransferase [Methylophilus rhizosphaerae]SDK80839.1 CDP-diacylglycerol--serine O-phosphatidyltransferase [Methylophilus rhizosphaerae]
MSEPQNRPSRREEYTTLRQRGIYLLPNLFTSASLFGGFYAIVQAMNQHFEQSAVAIFIAMVMDGLDGRVARMTNTQSAFGAEYDSLADMVSFGVAPALIVYVWALQPMGKLGWIAAFIYCACAALRLARFNTKIDDPFQDKRYFQGLPSPAAAALLAGFVWVSYEYNIDGREIFFGALQVKWIAWCLTVFAAGSMVSDLRFYSGKDINLRHSVPFVAILAVVLAFVLISYSPPEVLFSVVFVYTLSGYYLWGRDRMAKKNKA